MAAALVAADPASDPLAGLSPPESESGWRCPVRAAAIIGQGNGGAFSHTDRWNRYAWDYTVAVGTPVVAARSGTVDSVRTDSTIGGNDRRFLRDANRVIIRHSDGIKSVYLHLAKDRTLVRAGEFVLRGELIGYSGQTGFASGPHLHFTAVDALGDSIAITFVDYALTGGVPANGDLHGPAAPPVVPQAAIEACKKLLRPAHRAHELDRPDIGLGLLATLPTAKALDGYLIADHLKAYRASFLLRTTALVETWSTAPLDDVAVALAAKQAVLVLTPVKDAKDLVARLIVREQSLAPAVAKAASVAAARDLLAAAKAECAEDVGSAGAAYLAASRRGESVHGVALLGLKRLITTYRARIAADLARLDDESARCLPAHRDAVRADGDATARLCLSLAGYWKSSFPEEGAQADALLSSAQTAWERIQANVGKR